MDKTNDKTTAPASYDKEVTGLSYATARIMNTAGQLRDAQTTLELLKSSKAKADANDPDYFISDPDALDNIIEDLREIERRLCRLGIGNMEAHLAADDDLV